MRFVFHLLLMIAIALGLGFWLSWYALTDGRMFGTVQSGPWTAWPDVGSPTPNPYTRAHLTREAALQLGASEGLEFVATTDSDGQPLDLACTYRLDGHVPVSTFWTLVAVDAEWRNLAAPGTDAALRSSDVIRANDGSMRVEVGRFLAPYSWLELSGSGTFSLVLTLYDSTALTGLSSGTPVMPLITRGACA